MPLSLNDVVSLCQEMGLCGQWLQKTSVIKDACPSFSVNTILGI